VTELQTGCATAKSRIVRVGRLGLHYLEWGGAGRPPLLFLHGGSAHAHWFDAVAPAFADRHHVVSLDQRGHGESEWARPAAYATEEFAGDLQGFMDALGWRQAIVVGHSMGGHNAMAFAAWHPERVRALVVVDSRPAIPEERLKQMHARGYRALRLHPTREEAVAAFRLLPRETVADPRLLAHLATMGVVERDGGWVYRFDPEANRSRQPTDTGRLLDRIRAPALIVRGELSPILTREMAAHVIATIPGARFVEIPGTYHHLVLDAPGAFVRVLEDFLSRLKMRLK
jgi:pimeloyl-ACP methyl ester carboxylesterase